MKCLPNHTILRSILRAFRTLAVVAITAIAPTSAFAQDQTEDYVEDAGAANRIDSAGKLRMLSQRVVASACYVQAGIETEATTAMLNAASQEFKTITQALELGNPELGIFGEETDLKTLATLERLHAIWDPIAVIVDRVVSGNATQDEITQIALQSQPLLEMAQRLVTAVTAEHSLGATLAMRDALVIDIAGRQRMLAQRISKDVCLLATGIEREHSMEDLANTAELFDTSLAALRSGMPSAGLVAPTDDRAIADLDIAAEHWAIVQTKVADALSGEPINAEQLAVMFELANGLTADMNQVVIDFTKAFKEDL